MPKDCPMEIYKLITECWGEIGGTRKQPQAVMRDIFNIKYQVYHSKRTHAYAAALPRRFNDSESNIKEIETIIDNSSSDCESRASSIFTDNTILPWDDTDDSATGKKLFFITKSKFIYIV